MERNQLKAEMVRKGVSQKDMAEALGIAVSTFNRKAEEDSFTVKELRIMADLLGADTVQDVFFKEKG